MGPYETWKEKCPYCGNECEADFVDVGVGLVQCGPFHCLNCFASQIGPHDKPRELTPEEEKTGWYAPHSEPGSSANVVGGKVVDHVEALDIYKAFYPYSATEEGKENIRKRGF